MLFDMDEDAEFLNLRYAVVTRNGKTEIMRTDKPRLEYSSVYDFRNFCLHPKVRTVKGDRIGRGTAWFNYPGRRQFDGVRFEPGGPEVLPDNIFNSWRGFGCEPREGDCSHYLGHLRDIICSGDEGHFKYLIAWMADAIRRPGDLPGIAIALRGGMGIGKGEFVSNFGALFGVHFAHLVQPDQIIGKFNEHLIETVLLYGDEALFAGNASHAAALKALISEKVKAAERKNFAVELGVKNFTHVIFTSNSDWIIPAGYDERRWLVLDVSDARKRDFEYFNKIDAEMKNGGHSALLHMLLHHRLDSVNLRDVPLTAALQDQKLLSRSGIESFVEMICTDGVLPCSGPAPNACYSGDRTVDVQEDAGGVTAHRTEFREGLWTYLKKFSRDMQHSNPSKMLRQLKGWGCVDKNFLGKRRGVVFPPLSELREAFTKKYGTTEWPEETIGWGNRVMTGDVASDDRTAHWKQLAAQNRVVGSDEIDAAGKDVPSVPLPPDQTNPAAPHSEPLVVDAGLFQRIADGTSPGDAG